MINKKFITLCAMVLLVTGCDQQEQKVEIQKKQVEVTQTPTKSTEKTSQSLNRSTIYYFHGNKRCTSCLKIEAYTKETFNEFFKDKFDLKIVNVDDAENQHFIKDYQLYSKSVILAKIKDGKQVGYKNLDKIWTLLGDQKKFKNYVKNEINQYL